MHAKRTHFADKYAWGYLRADPASLSVLQKGPPERESPPDESHAERLVMPSGRLMVFVVAAQERPGVRAARHNQRPRRTHPALHDTGRALRTAQVRPPLSIKSQAEMQARDGPSQLPCVWRPANTMTEDRQPPSGGTYPWGPAVARIMPTSRARNPCPAREFVSTSA